MLEGVTASGSGGSSVEDEAFATVEAHVQREILATEALLEVLVLLASLQVITHTTRPS